jgi:uncharacterized protein
MSSPFVWFHHNICRCARSGGCCAGTLEEGVMNPMSDQLVISAMFAGLFALLQLPITVAVGLRRVRTGIQFLDGGDVRLLRRGRAHGNFTETVPIALISMAAAEVTGASAGLLLPGGCALLIGRVLHYVTILRSGWGLGRSAGMVLTLLPIALFGVYPLLAAAWYK